MNKVLRVTIFATTLLLAKAVLAVGPYCDNHCTTSTPCSDICYADSTILQSTSPLSAVIPNEVVKMTCGNYGVCKPVVVVPPTYSDVVPYYDPSFWNNSSSIQLNNNCYNYAANKITNNFAQPGYAASNEGFSSNPTCQGVMSGANADQGISAVSSLCDVGAKETALAVVVWPGYDYHWYRRDNNSQWSHKPGQTAVRNIDNSGQLIFDPRYANRGSYSQFCGFYKTKSYDIIGDNRTHQNKGVAVISGVFRSAGAAKTPQVALVKEPTQGVTAEILIFSGMPNPKIKLAVNSAPLNSLQAMQTRVRGQSLQENENLEKVFSEGGLGYQGILIHDSSGVYFDKSKRVFIKGNAIKIQNIIDQSAQVFETSDYLLEQQVLDQALQERKLDLNLLNAIKQGR